MKTQCCEKLLSIYEGVQVKDVPELFERLTEVSTDFKNWVTIFECSKCGQKWEERFVQRGHGEVPEVKKL
jgi:hypothetical protein